MNDQPAKTRTRFENPEIKGLHKELTAIREDIVVDKALPISARSKCGWLHLAFVAWASRIFCPHVLNAMRVLDNILRRMQAHQAKKRAMLRELHLSHGLSSEATPATDLGNSPTFLPR